MPGTRNFLIGCLLIAALIIAVPLLTTPVSDRASSADVTAGFDLWRANGCAGCHAIYGQGESYASDLTDVYERRGEAHLRDFMIHPDAYMLQSDRVMPRFSLTRDETDQLIVFLQYAGRDAQPFPFEGNREIGMNRVDDATAAPSPVLDAAVAGRVLFSRAPGNCATCHSLQSDVVIVGPSLAGVATRASERIEGMSASDYLRQSLIMPGEFIVPGFANVMAQNLGASLSNEQIDHLIAFLLTLEG